MRRRGFRRLVGTVAGASFASAVKQRGTGRPRNLTPAAESTGGKGHPCKTRIGGRKRGREGGSLAKRVEAVE